MIQILPMLETGRSVAIRLGHWRVRNRYDALEWNPSIPGHRRLPRLRYFARSSEAVTTSIRAVLKAGEQANRDMLPRVETSGFQVFARSHESNARIVLIGDS